MHAIEKRVNACRLVCVGRTVQSSMPTRKRVYPRAGSGVRRACALRHMGHGAPHSSGAGTHTSARHTAASVDSKSTVEYYRTTSNASSNVLSRNARRTPAHRPPSTACGVLRRDG
ncbi:hypothetical protein EVAR_88305_1 [Eumeta japonica]|uniref:Uncharacterized protein n=1 Tax=Eumeta variegata TaxID=151549 RepID=A0A4C1VPK3_EUMVA|nr:hypothetical protein EVAR_88305_1 [Eumeta japonica]